MTLLLSDFGLLILEVWILMSIALLLHFISSRYGFWLLLMYVALMASALIYSNPVTVLGEPAEGIIITIPADIFVPVILGSILVIYVSNGTPVTQLVIYGITLIQVLVTIVILVIGLHTRVASTTFALQGELFSTLVQMDFWLLAGTIGAFLADMFVIAIMYQGTRNLFPTRGQWLAIGAAVVVALWTDSIVFNLLNSPGQGEFVRDIPGDIISKTITGLALAPMLSLYLGYLLKTGYIASDTTRPTFDILNDLLADWHYKAVQLENQLKSKEMTIKQMIEHVDELFWVAKRNSTHAQLSAQAFMDIVGVSADVYYQNPAMIYERVHPDDVEMVRREKWLAYTNQYREIEFRIIRRPDDIRMVRDRTYLVYDPARGIDHVVGITEDITIFEQQKQLQTAITIEREKYRFLYDLVSDISHDLKTPINAIEFKVELLKMVKKKEQEQYLLELTDQTHQLGQLVEHIFAFIKMQSQAEYSLSDETELNTLCQQMIDRVAHEAAEKYLSVTLNPTEMPVMVQCHLLDLQRAITNLITNAIRYTPAGGSITVTLSTEAGMLSVAVQDTGIGIGEEELQHIFDRFYRATNAKNINGTGLGLAITNTIVEKHGGRLSVESTLNIGSTFTMTLPIADTPQQDAD